MTTRSSGTVPAPGTAGFDLYVAEQLAAGWERRREWVESVAGPVGDWLVREARVPSDGTVLELAAGLGETGYRAARSLGPTGRLVTSDHAGAMVDAARRRAGELGVTGVEHRVIDAEHIDLDDDSIDAVLCRFGYMLMRDHAAAIAETRRVLRPGGRLALAVWSAPERNPLLSALALVLVGLGHMPPPDPAGPSPFRLSDAGELERLLRDGGFDDVRLEEVPVQARFASVDEFLAITADTAGTMALVLRELDDRHRRAVADRLAETFEPWAADGGYVLPGVALCAAAA